MVSTERGKELERKLEQLLMMFDLIQEFVVMKDGQSRWLIANRTVLETYGLAGVDYRGKTDLELAEIRPEFADSFRYNASTDEQAWNFGAPIQIEKSFRVGGALQTWEVAKTPLFTETGERRLLVIVSRNVTERNKVEQKLRDSERKFRMIAEHMRDLLFVVSPQGTIRYASPSVEATLGYGAADLADLRFASLLPDEERAKGERLLAAIRESGGADAKEEFRLSGRNGRALWFEAVGSLLEEEDGIRDAVVTARDIDIRKRYEQQMLELAYQDPVTGGPNRRSFFERLERETSASERTGGRLAVLYLDIDHFKQVNDEYGHPGGDQLIRQMAERIRACLRSSDMVGRIGGDEFAVLLAGVESQKEVERIAERICAALREPWDIDGRRVTTTSSIGVASFPEDGVEPKALLRHADRALYEAKRLGKSRVAFYIP